MTSTSPVSALLHTSCPSTVAGLVVPVHDFKVANDWLRGRTGRVVEMPWAS